GISPDVIPRIFEPFFTTKDQGKGTGMGLAMVYGIVQNHGGFIEVDSALGCGTTFRLYLPEAGKGEPRSLQKTSGEIVEAGSGTILVIDDEDTVRSVATAFLEELGYRVLTASGGAEAVEVFRASRETIDLVIIDMVMPAMGGRECFRTLKTIRPELTAVL